MYSCLWAFASIFKNGVDFWFRLKKCVDLRRFICFVGLYQSRQGFFQEGQRRQLVLERFEAALAHALHRRLPDLIQLSAQLVQEQRVDHLMDILDGGIVHPALAPSFRVQRGFKHRAEYGGADLAPVEVLAGLGQQQFIDRFIEGWNLDIFIREQAAVDIGERR